MANPPSFYFPGEDFRITRSYLRGLNVRQDGMSAVLSGNLLTFVVVPPPTTFYITILEEFVPWSSNHFRLGDIFLDAYFVQGGITYHVPFPWDVGYLIPTGETRGSLHVNIHYGSDTQTIPLPYSPPEDYWLPEPLPM